MKKLIVSDNSVIYQTKSGSLELRGDISRETIWATQKQIADIFNIERSVTTKHIRNILKNQELDKKSVCAIFAHTGSDGKVYQGHQICEPLIHDSN